MKDKTQKINSNKQKQIKTKPKYQIPSNEITRKRDVGKEMKQMNKSLTTRGVSYSTVRLRWFS